MRAMRSLACSAALALIVCMGHAPAPVLAQDTRDEPVQLNLVDTDIGGVLRMAARFTGRQFLVDPRVTGKMTVVSDGPVSRTQAYQLLLGALRMRGFAVVENGGVSRWCRRPMPSCSVDGWAAVVQEARLPRAPLRCAMRMRRRWWLCCY